MEYMEIFARSVLFLGWNISQSHEQYNTDAGFCRLGHLKVKNAIEKQIVSTGHSKLAILQY